MDDVMTLERAIDLPRVIVWDALVDPVLVEGWLHPTAQLRPVTESVEPGLLAVESQLFGALLFELAQLPGGTRGTSTRLRLQITLPDDGARAELERAWQTRLDQLENLLRGHPVDWRARHPDGPREGRAR